MFKWSENKTSRKINAQLHNKPYMFNTTIIKPVYIYVQ